MFLFLPMLSISVSSFDITFAFVGQIYFALWWVWKTLVWLRILWYVLFLRLFLVFWRACCWCLGLWSFCIKMSQVQMCYFCIWIFSTNKSRIQSWLTPCILLALKNLVLLPNSKTILIAILWFCDHSASYRCSYSNNMVCCAPMGGIHRPYEYCRGGTEAGAFI